jgi:excisionase family DNA binding protein
MGKEKTDQHAGTILFPYAPELFWDQMRCLLREELGKGHDQLDLRPPNGMSNKPIYKIKEVCALFTISKPTVYEWVKAGKLHPVKIRTRVYFRGNEVEALFAQSDKPVTDVK